MRTSPRLAGLQLPRARRAGGDPEWTADELLTPVDPRLDWRPRHDPRSRLYAIADVPATPGDRLPDRHRDGVLLPVTRPPLLQGPEGACAGFAAAHAANTHRLQRGEVAPLAEVDARGLYASAQRLDHVPGEDYSGTSILAAMLAGREAGLWPEFRWAFGTADIARTLLEHRLPVVIGIPWTASMYETDAQGRVQVEGPTVGGHALEVVGFVRQHPDLEGRPAFAWLNSHDDYGLDGLGWLSARQLGWLLTNRGEAAVPMPGGAA